jgi:hypothetical protein
LYTANTKFLGPRYFLDGIFIVDIQLERCLAEMVKDCSSILAILALVQASLLEQGCVNKAALTASHSAGSPLRSD